MFLQFIFLILLLSVSVSAQTTINGKQYKDLLWGKEQEFDVTDFPDGSFYKTPSDFIGTSGKLWKGPPPPSNGTFSYRDELVTNSGEFNNKALELIETGDLKNRDIAIDMLEKAVRFDPHFFPFRYNLGRLYQLKSFYEKAARQFEYAVSEVPEFYRTYIHIGKMYELQNQPDYAVQMYKQAARLNRFNIEALIFLGEHFLDGGLKNRAAYYFKTALHIDEESPNARMGIARLQFNSKNYFNAYKIFRKTDLFETDGRLKEYDKKFHFYFAEAASLVGDYIVAEREYIELLKYPNDPFFSNFSIKAIERRKDIASKFATIKKTQEEEKKNQ